MINDAIGAVGLFTAVQLAVLPAPLVSRADILFKAQDRIAEASMSTVVRSDRAHLRTDGCEFERDERIISVWFAQAYPDPCFGEVPPAFHEFMHPGPPPLPRMMPNCPDEEAFTAREAGAGMAAMQLAILEIRIGIRTQQLESWRNFTDALLALIESPGSPSESLSEDEAEGGAGPLGAAARMAVAAIDRAERARDLQAALDKVRAELSPEQLDRAAGAEPPELPPPLALSVARMPGGSVPPGNCEA